MVNNNKGLGSVVLSESPKPAASSYLTKEPLERAVARFFAMLERS